MDVLALLIFFSLISSTPRLINAQQPYVGKATTACGTADNSSSVLGYTCNGIATTCQAYLTFRSQFPYDTVSYISQLLNSDPSQISQINSPIPNIYIDTDQLVFVPVNCSCTGSGGQYYQSNTSYVVQPADTYFSIANNTFQSLSTCQALQAQNSIPATSLSIGDRISVPLRCACPTKNQSDNNGVKYLLSYLVTLNQEVSSISTIFGVNYTTTLEANELSSSDPTIYPFTILLIPLQNPPTGSESLAPPPPPPPPPSSSSNNNNSTSTKKGENNSRKLRTAVIVAVPTSITLLLIGSTFFLLRKRIKNSKTDIPSKGDGSIDLPIFNVATIAEATNNFSSSNKIGEGGYGPVFKGQLSTGQLIAVKRNSEKSNQGLREFKNEVTLIAKLQHRNLVRLLGCCIEGEERMLIYEYMPNGSLNSFIFENRSNRLAWSRRFDIIVGIARGLLYLHRDSRLRIVHRDLKASNVLLDDQMNPKIADFGLARAFRGDQQLEKTGKVVGTYGYMSPEYVMDGLFSMKSDVYSFGVLVLEIVSGKRNREFFHPDHGLTLLGHAWKLWIEGKALELVHEQMDDFPIPETLKCIQVGLLCVQQHPEDRLTMPSVLLALDSESATLPQPKQPGFYTERSSIETEPSSSGNQSNTTNEMTLTVLSGR